MHVLTKIFIVLVSLLAVAIVPLVAVHAANEGTFKSKWIEERDRAAMEASAHKAAEAEKAAAQAKHDDEISALNSQLEAAKRDAQAKVGQIRALEADLASSKALQAEIRTDIGIIRSTGDANAKMTASLVEETRDLRTKLIETERNYVQLDATLSETLAQLDVADAARKALQEEVQRLTEEKMAMNGKLEQYRVAYGDIGGDIKIGALRNVVPADRDLTATIIDVSRKSDQALAEINAGSRDGVKEGWVLMVGDNGSFVGQIRIINVDVNRSTGVIEKETKDTKVQIGQKAKALRGE